MKRGVTSRLVFSSLLPLLLGGCGGKSEQAAATEPERLIETAPRVIAAIPRSHATSSAGELVAMDLQHGAVAKRLTVQRRWNGRGTLNQHFGAGWADGNLVRLTQVSSETAIIWRGGRGWRLGHGRAAEFKTREGDLLSKASAGWTFRTADGEMLTFDEAGRLISFQVAGTQRNYKYTPQGQLTEIAESAQNFLRYGYDENGRVKSVAGPENLQATYRYDSSGRLIEVVNDAGIKIEYRYDSNGALQTAQDQFGQLLDVAGLTSLVSPTPSSTPQTRAATGLAQYKYDEFGRLTEIAIAGNGTTRFEYNALDLPTLLVNPDGSSERFTYNRHGMPIRHDFNGTAWERFSYDTNGRLLRRARFPGGEESFTYDEQDRVTKRKMPSGAEVTYGYDGAGNVIAESWTGREKITRRYDAKNRLVELVDIAGLKSDFRYDDAGQLLEVRDPVHGRTSYKESPDGLVIEREKIGKVVLQNTESGKPLAITDGGHRTSYAYDENEMLLRVFPPDHLAARYEYDAAQNLTGIFPAGAPRISLRLDERGRTSEITRGEVLWRRFRYEDNGQVLEESSPLGSAAKFDRDKEGRLHQITTPQGNVTLSFSGDGKLTTKASDFSLEEEFHGDGALRRRSYQPAQLNLKLPRDSFGRRAGIELNDLKVAYQYDGRGQLDRIDLPGGRSIQIERDAAGRIIRLAAGEALSADLTYDIADRLSAVKARSAKEPALFSETYKFDAAGNISEIANSNGVNRFEYDLVNRLTKRTSSSGTTDFRYDAGGNLYLSGRIHWLLDPMGRPTQQGPKSFSWDPAGNLAGITDARSNIANKFDAAGRLTERTTDAGKWRFGYLPNGDRLWRDNSKGKAWYVYTDEGVAGLKDESGTVWLVVNLPGTDWPVALCGSNGKSYFIVSDHLHSTRRIVDETGQIVAAADFDPFGLGNNPKATSPFLSFAGMLFDESGLLYARQRYYDPSLGRFISIDPLLGTPGDVASHNAYAYAANNPLRFRDPSGTRVVYVDFTNWTNAQLEALHSLRAEYFEEANRYLTNWDFDQEREALRTEMQRRGFQQSSAPAPSSNPPPKVKPASGVPGPRAKVETVAVKPSAKGSTLAVKVPPKGDTLAVVVKTAGETSSALKSIVRGLGTTLKFAGAIGDFALAAEVAHGFTTMTLAAGEANDAAAFAKAIKNALENKLVEALRNDPSKIMPLPDGRKPDPNKPQDIEEMLIQLHSNLTKNRKPFEGILASEPDPAQQAELDAALAKARELIAKGHLLETDANEAQARALEKESEAQSEVQAALKIAGARALVESDLADLPGAADNVKKGTAEAQKQTQALRAAESEMTAAVTSSENAATRTCDFAAQSAKATQEQVQAWQTEANSLIFQASNQLNRSQEKIDGADIASDTLRTAVTVLQGFKTGQEMLQFAEAVKANLAQAKAAQKEAVAARAKIPPLLTQIRAIAPQVKQILQPVAWSPAIVSVQAEADALGTGFEERSAFLMEALMNSALPVIDELLTNLDRVEKLIASTNIDALASAANAALTEADSVRTSVRSLAASPERYRPLQRASKCFAEIKFAAKTPSPTPSPTVTPSPAVTRSPAETPSPPATAASTADEEVSVPNLAGFDNVAEMKAALASVGLNGALVAASDKPPSKEKEFKFAGQAPAANMKVKRGSTVSIAMYPKFEEVSDEVTVPDLSRYGSPGEIKNALAQLGLTASFIAAKEKPPSKDRELKFASQSPGPETKVKRGSTVTVAFYAQLETAEAPVGVVPDVIGLTIQQAQTRIEAAGLKLGGVESGTLQPPSPDKAYKVYAQIPRAGEPAPGNQIVMVKEYGSGQRATAPPTVTGQADAFLGRWSGPGTVLGERRNITIEVRREGNSYVFIDAQGKSAPATLTGGMLVAIGDVTVRIGSAPAKKSGTSKTIMELRGDTLHGTTSVTALDGQTIPAATFDLRRQ